MVQEKITRIKRGGYKEMKLKHYTADSYKKALGEVQFPNYESFANVNGLYNFHYKINRSLWQNSAC